MKSEVLTLVAFSGRVNGTQFRIHGKRELVDRLTIYLLRSFVGLPALSIHLPERHPASAGQWARAKQSMFLDAYGSYVLVH